MNHQMSRGDQELICRSCITGTIQQLTLRHGALVNIAAITTGGDNIPLTGPGLIDLQINGINGIDFNNSSLSKEDVIRATYYLLRKGITTFLPTVITNSDDNIRKVVHTIYSACLSDPVVNDCIWGIHLEGPFISPEAGAKGAHDATFIKAPDWELLHSFQQAAGGKIRLVTLAPEWEGACSFIERCTAHGIIVSIGHSMANSEQIGMAVSSGASLSTHLGNGVPLLVQRHPNIIWDQLAAEELHACIITDGIHIPDSFIKVVIKNKADATIIVSDATCFAGMPAGEYSAHIGGEVILDREKRLSLKNAPKILAGAASSLLENVENLVNKKISTISEAWQMASANAAKMLSKHDTSFVNKNDHVIFQFNEKEIGIHKVIKSGRIVFER